MIMTVVFSEDWIFNIGLQNRKTFTKWSRENSEIIISVVTTLKRQREEQLSLGLMW